eukprot:361389-Chlamydomonas_euryale.AAC.7
MSVSAGPHLTSQLSHEFALAAVPVIRTAHGAPSEACAARVLRHTVEHTEPRLHGVQNGLRKWRGTTDAMFKLLSSVNMFHRTCFMFKLLSSVNSGSASPVTHDAG